MWTKQIKKSFIANTFVAMNDFCVARDESHFFLLFFLGDHTSVKELAEGL